MPAGPRELEERAMADFDDLVAVRYHSALTLHGDLGVDGTAFANHLRRVIERHLGSSEIEETTLLGFVSTLHTDDLMLALACAKGINDAWQRFSDLYRKYVADLSRHLAGPGLDAQELGEAIWVDLFLPDRSGESRIASYDGRSSLSTWLRVVVSNRMINERVRRSSWPTNLEGIPEPVDPDALKDLETHLDLSRYKPMILWSFQRALQCLTPKERLIVLLRYEQTLQLGDIARLFSVHQSTITRQMDRAANRLRKEVIRLLDSHYHLSGAAIEECLSIASEALSNSISALSLLKVISHNTEQEVSYSLGGSDKI
jgi:RNA polymerase sigma-70 factor